MQVNGSGNNKCSQELSRELNNACFIEIIYKLPLFLCIN